MTGPANADRAAWAAQAIEAFQSAAGHHREPDAAEAIGGLITALCHYADRRGISFGEILTSSSEAYLSQRASEQHPYKVGDEVRIRDSAVLAPSLATLPRLGIVAALYPSAERTQQYAIRFPGEINAMPFISSEIEPAPPFQPVRTRQGTVTSLAEAEEVLISTAARIQISHLHKTRPARADLKDRHLLASVLGQACSLTPQEMLRQAGIQVTAIVQRELAMQAAADLGREHARTGTRPFETELETAARLADVLREKGCALPSEMTPARTSCSGNTASHSATRKPDSTSPGRPAAKGYSFASRASRAEFPRPSRPAAQYGANRRRQQRAWTARPESSKREAAPMTAQDDQKHCEQDETPAETGNSTWTAEAIRALGATTDLQTLADIFGCSGWSSRKMARTGEWERQGIKIFRIGAHYRVGVGSILDVLGFTSADLSTPGTAHADELDQDGGNATDSAVTQAPESVAAGGRR